MVCVSYLQAWKSSVFGVNTASACVHDWLGTYWSGTNCVLKSLDTSSNIHFVATQQSSMQTGETRGTFETYPKITMARLDGVRPNRMVMQSSGLSTRALLTHEDGHERGVSNPNEQPTSLHNLRNWLHRSRLRS